MNSGNPDVPTTRVTALLADYARSRAVAFAPHATLELVERPVITPVPGAAYYAHGLLRWQDRQRPEAKPVVLHPGDGDGRESNMADDAVRRFRHQRKRQGLCLTQGLDQGVLAMIAVGMIGKGREGDRPDGRHVPAGFATNDHV